MSGLIFNSINSIIVTDTLLASFNRRPKSHGDVNTIKLTKFNKFGLNKYYLIKFFDGPKIGQFSVPNKVIKLITLESLGKENELFPSLDDGYAGIPQHMAQSFILNLIQMKLDAGYVMEPSLNEASAIAYLAEGFLPKRTIRYALKKFISRELAAINSSNVSIADKIDWYVIDSRGVSAINNEIEYVSRIASAAKFLRRNLGQNYSGAIYS